MHTRRRALTLAFVLVCLAATTPAGVSGQQPQQPNGSPAGPPPQGQAPADQQPIFRGGINFVRVDVIVSDRDGKPVIDLSEKDFEVLEDGKPQRIESFKLVEVRPGAVTNAAAEAPREIRTDADEEIEAAKDDARIVAIFLDDYHVRRSNSLKGRNALIDFIQNRLVPSDILALMYPLTPLSEVRLTRNHAAVMSAISNFEGRKYDYRPRNLLEEGYSHYPASTVERIRHQVTMSAMKALAIRLGALREGRKAMLFVSEGFASRLPPQLSDPIADQPGLGNPDHLNPLAGSNPSPTENAANFFAETDVLNDLRDVYDVANRNNTAIYALDPRGLTGQEFGIDENVNMTVDSTLLNQSMDSLRVLADNTDGHAIVSQGDLGKGLQQVLSDSSTYYLLGYNSTLAPQDGKFHKIDVRVKRARVQVRSRRGYWALTAEAAASAAAPAKPGPAPAVEAALNTLAAIPRGRVVRTWIGMAPAEHGKTRVTFVWEPAPPSSGRREEPERIMLVAAGSRNDPYFRGSVPDRASTASAAPASATGDCCPTGTRGPWRVTFDADPGRIQLMFTVEGRDAQVLDKDSQDITVPDLTTTDTVLGTPQIFRSRSAREWQTAAADASAVPAVAREFSRGERLLIRFGVYGPGAPTLSARLLNRAGERMSDLQVQAATVGGQLHQVDLPLAALAAGEYLIEVAAGAVTQLVAIRVTS